MHLPRVDMLEGESIDISLPNGRTLNIECTTDQIEVTDEEGTIIYKAQRSDATGKWFDLEKIPVEQSFADWKKEVNAEITKRVGVSGDDIPDVDYMGLYQSGDSPVDAAEFALDESGMTWRDADVQVLDRSGGDID